MTPCSLRNCTFKLSCTFGGAADLVEEIHVPGGAAEFAVGDALQADFLLQLDHVADRIVFDAAEIGRGDTARS